MPLIHDIKNEIREAQKIRLPWWGVLCWMACCALIVWLLIDLGRFDLAVPTLNSVGVLGFFIALKRKLGRKVWFWITVAFFAALHVPLILFLPWTTRWVPALAIAAIDSADLIAMLAILAVVGQLVDGPRAAER